LEFLPARIAEPSCEASQVVKFILDKVAYAFSAKLIVPYPLSVPESPHPTQLEQSNKKIASLLLTA
jgi:hypothetical protein